MKNYGKAVLGFVFLMMTVALFPVTSKAATAPTNLRQTDATRVSVDVAWDAVPGESTYWVQWCNDGISWGDTAAKTSKTSGTISDGLNAGESRYVRVAVYDSETYEYLWSEPIEVVTSPNATTITQLNAVAVTPNSLTFSWNPCMGATSYNILDYSNNVVLATTTDTTFTWNGLAPNSLYGIKVVPVRTSKSGFAAYTNFSALYNVSTAKVAPAAPENKTYIASASINAMTVSFYAADLTRNANGYEVEVYKMKGGKKVKTLSANNGMATNSMKVTKDTVYKYRVRYYVTNNGQNTYGPWSGYRHFCMQKVIGKKSYKLGGKYASIKLSWKKIAGASGYTVYASTSRNGKYKKVKSLGKNAKGITFRKLGKSKLKRATTYYVKVVPKVKDGKKTITNDTQIIQVGY